MRARRGLAFVFAFLLVATAATSGVVPGASPVGDARAEWVDCNLGDSLIGAAYNTLIGADTNCRWEAGDQIDYQNISQTDAYAQALGIGDSADSYTTSMGNMMANARTVATSKAKITLINELNNGTSVSVAKQRVNETIEDYYARIEMENARDYSRKWTQLGYNDDTTNLAVGVGGGSIHSTEAHNSTQSDADWVVHSINATALNGTQFEVTSLVYGPDDPSGGQTEYGGVPADYSVSGFIEGSSADRIYIEDPETGGWKPIVDASAYQQIRADALDQASQVKANMDPYADEVYAQYAAGELNSTDLATMDPSVIGAEASTDFGTTGYYGQAAIMLASIGASGDLNASHTIAVGDGTTANTTVLNGTLFYTADDVDGWDTGTTYNISDNNGTFYMAVQADDGSGSVVDLDDYGSEFTITEAVNTRTGETLNTTAPQRYAYDSTNASALESEIGRLKQLRQEYETAGSGGSSSGGGFDSQTLGIALLVGAAAVLLIQREGNE
ncbi:hypothetical protein [Haloferax volcanii]|uniref:hypothetical protein n=1 Tax=Haloferax volcanii TaxID=2246 RepID=UPI00385C6830